MRQRLNQELIDRYAEKLFKGIGIKDQTWREYVIVWWVIETFVNREIYNSKEEVEEIIRNIVIVEDDK